MAVELTTKIWKIKFPTMSQKFIAMCMADAASSNGFGIWPAINTIAADAQCDRRTVQRVARLFEDIGLIELAKDGGGTTTNFWNMDVELLEKLYSRKCHLIGDSTTLEVVSGEPVDMCGQGGGVTPPLPDGGAASDASGGGLTPRGGRSDAAQTVNEPLRRTASRAHEGARGGGDGDFNLNWICEEYGIGLDDVKAWADGLITAHGQDAFDTAVAEYRTKADTGEITKPGLGTIAVFVTSYTAPAKKKSKLDAFAKGKADVRVAVFEIRRTDPQWKAWMDHLIVADEDLFATVQRTGKLEVSTRWPADNAVIHSKADNPANDADRITGDVDR